jgi:hypothetical protein
VRSVVANVLPYPAAVLPTWIFAICTKLTTLRAGNDNLLRLRARATWIAYATPAEVSRAMRAWRCDRANELPLFHHEEKSVPASRLAFAWRFVLHPT